MKNILLTLFLVTSIPSLGADSPALSKTQLPEEVQKEIELLNEAEVPASAKVANGTLANPEAVPHIVKLFSPSGSMCTATFVGPSTLLSAAHCGYGNSTGYIEVRGKYYSVNLYRPKAYRGGISDHDIMLVQLANGNSVPGISSYATIGGRASDGQNITFYGYGCNGMNSAGKPRADGRLRIGTTQINRTNFTRYHVNLRRPNGSTYCYGDSGGPNFTSDGKLLGITSTGDGRNNQMAQLDIPESQSYLKEMGRLLDAKICGINSSCGASVIGSNDRDQTGRHRPGFDPSANHDQSPAGFAPIPPRRIKN